MSDIFAPNLLFLNSLEPIPEDAEKFEVSLMEKCIYGHLRHIRENPVKIMISSQGARRLMDIVYALRLENQSHPSLSIHEMKFPARTFGITIHLNQIGEVVVGSNGLCQLKISEVGGRWKRTFWLDMLNINTIGHDEPSNITKDRPSIGNMEISMYMITKDSLDKQAFFGGSLLSMPILNLDRLALITRKIVPWHNVDPVQDGHFGVAGYLTDNGNDQPIYGALDIYLDDARDFISGKFNDGIIIMSRIVDQKPDGTFPDQLCEAEKLVPPEIGHFIKRIRADLNIAYGCLDIYGREFSNHQYFTFDDAEKLLASWGMDLVEASGAYDITHEGKSLLSLDGIMSDAQDANERNRAYIARFVDIMLKPLRSHPFLYRRNVLMNVPIDVLVPFMGIQ